MINGTSSRRLLRDTETSSQVIAQEDTPVQARHPRGMSERHDSPSTGSVSTKKSPADSRQSPKTLNKMEKALFIA